MLAQIRKFLPVRLVKLAVLASASACFASCATKPEPQLVSDPSARPESALPWNKQEQWENAGQLGPLSEQLNGSRR